jgi:hypothetical protein
MPDEPRRGPGEQRETSHEAEDVEEERQKRRLARVVVYRFPSPIFRIIQ